MARKVTLRGILKLVNDLSEILIPFDLTRRDAYRRVHSEVRILNFEDYFPSEVIRVTKSLERKGLVVKEQTESGWKIKITEKGKNELLEFDLSNLKPKRTIWDGEWRIVFFDICETHRQKRYKFTKYLRMLGMKEIQKSVYVSPFDVFPEVKYIREVLNIADEVKMGILTYLENQEDLKKIFKVGDL